MNTKHTPGPWQVELGRETGRPLGIYAPGDAGIPGAVGGVVRRNGIGLPSSPVALANARLIAAAPDLLAAAKIVLAGIHERINAAPKNAVPVFVGIADLHDAIAKAEDGT